jgi:tripartite-type tricarboxylate transporter receptor subunit TctC
MNAHRRQFLHLAAGAAAMPIACRIARAQAYPTRPVRLIIGIAPGSSPDILGRLMAQWLSDRLGQPFIVENRPGGGGNIAIEAVVKAPADGHTLLLVTIQSAVNATLYDKLNYNFIRDIAPVASISRQTLALEVTPSFPAKTVPEFIAYAKANPGRLTMASAGNGTTPHVAGELFKMMASVDLIHVPYRGGAPAMTDLVGGQVQLTFADIASSIEYVKAGKVRALAVTTTARSEALPDLPRLPTICPARRRAAGLASAYPRTRPPRSSKGLTMRSTPASPVRKSRRGMRNWAPRCLAARRRISAGISPTRRRNGPK